MSLLKSRGITWAAYAVPLMIILFVSYTGIGKGIDSQIISWAVIIWVFSYLVGIYNMFSQHAMKIIKKAEGFQYSFLLFASFFLLLAYAYMPHNLGYDWYVVNLMGPMRLVLKLSGFFTALFIYRGARARSIETGLLLLSMSVITLGSSALGPIIGPWVMYLAEWFNKVVNTGVMRAITIGTAVGLLVTFVRALMGLEKSYMGE